MAKKIKFGLEMADGFNVRRIEELREHFDLETGIKHFTSGKLLEWLEDRFYDEAEKIGQLDKDNPDFQRQLCEILGVEPQEDVNKERDIDAIARTNEKETILRQKTSDAQIIANAAKTAFDRDDLVELWGAGEETIYLCGDEFNIPLRVGNVKYVGILGTPKISIGAKSHEELAEKNISFENVELPEALREKKSTGITPCSKCETDKTPSTQAEWKIPKLHLRLMFATAFKKTNEADKNNFGNTLDTDALFYMYMADGNGELEQKLTDEQKSMAMTLICGGKYTEDELLQMRFSSDMTFGWAFTNDSFCILRDGTLDIIPYEAVKELKPDGLTLVLGDNREIFISQYFMYCDVETTPIHKFLIDIRNTLQRKS